MRFASSQQHQTDSFVFSGKFSIRQATHHCDNVFRPNFVLSPSCGTDAFVFSGNLFPEKRHRCKTYHFLDLAIIFSIPSRFLGKTLLVEIDL